MKQILFAGIALLAITGAPVATALHPTSCGGAQFDIDAQIRTAGDDLRFVKNSTEVARMTGDHRLLVQSNELAIGQVEREAVARYIQSHRALMADAKQIGIEGAHIGISAALGAIRYIFASEFSRARFEADMESRAAELEARAESLCAHVVDLRREHLVLSARLPAFGQAVPLKD